jgi:hypothetical protein
LLFLSFPTCVAYPAHLNCPNFSKVTLPEHLYSHLTHPLSSCRKPFSRRDVDHLSTIFLQRYCHLLQRSITTVGTKYLSHDTSCLETSIAS